MKKFVIGIACGFLLAMILIPSHPLEARKPTHMEMIHKIVEQNFYLIQKNIAFQQYNAEILEKIAEKTKIKAEVTAPAKNRLQQEIFQMDLKIKELNR